MGGQPEPEPIRQNESESENGNGRDAGNAGSGTNGTMSTTIYMTLATEAGNAIPVVNETAQTMTPSRGAGAGHDLFGKAENMALVHWQEIGSMITNDIHRREGVERQRVVSMHFAQKFGN